MPHFPWCRDGSAVPAFKPRERSTMTAFNMFGVSYVAAIAIVTFAAVAAL